MCLIFVKAYLILSRHLFINTGFFLHRLLYLYIVTMEILYRTMSTSKQRKRKYICVRGIELTSFYEFDIRLDKSFTETYLWFRFGLTPPVCVPSLGK